MAIHVAQLKAQPPSEARELLKDKCLIRQPS
jgi:hypothetical protein